MSDNQIRMVAVAGNGLVAWSAAAAIRRRLPILSVTIIPSAADPAALADRIESSLPSISDFHQDIGLAEANTIARAGSGIRLGTNFVGWAAEPKDYVHAYGDYGAPLGAAAFHQHWLRAARSKRAEPFDCYSAAAQIARAGKFAAPDPTANPWLGRVGFGLHLHPTRYREMMRAYALHLGANEQPGELAGVRLASNGSIAGLQIDDGSEVTADLYIDATGPQSRLRSALGGDWESWGEWLLTDRLIFAESEPALPQPLDQVTAISAGWTWSSSSPARTSAGIVYSSRDLDDSSATELLEKTAGAVHVDEPVSIRQGRWSQPWERNCVAIGDSAVAIEPLEWTNLHLAHNAIDRVIALLPDRDFKPVELWDYNRQATAEADRVRDFIVMHYATATRGDEAFWSDWSSRLPGSLDHTLTQFRERGRLPFYEEETFSRDSWLAVLIGQGVFPRRIDPLLEAVPVEQSAKSMAQLREGILRAVQSLPTHSQFLQTLTQKVA